MHKITSNQYKYGSSESPGKLSESPGKSSESPGKSSEFPGRSSESPGFETCLQLFRQLLLLDLVSDRGPSYTINIIKLRFDTGAGKSPMIKTRTEKTL